MPAGTRIDNTVTGTYTLGTTRVITSSNTVTTVTVLAVTADSVVFDSSNGLAVDGALIRLVDANTGLPAVVLGDDGVSAFPNPVVSGSTVNDTGGKVYSFATGHYRFPVINPGNYRLEVTPPGDYLFPTGFSDAYLQTLPGAPWSLNSSGSRGQNFAVISNAFDIDIPLDRKSVLVSKTANKSVVGKGEYIQYAVTIDNTSRASDLLATVLIDDLPTGFRYKPGSSKRNGLPLADPVISANGQNLRWNIGTVTAGRKDEIRYVVQVSANVPTGDAINRARTVSAGGINSAVAQYPVVVREDLFVDKSYLAGRVMIDACELPDDAPPPAGLQHARVYLEDGTYVQTDEEGRWHIEGVNPGNHIVQLDLHSIPPEYEVVMCEENTAHAGTAFSKFVDLKRGSLWRTDFYLKLRPPRESSLQQLLKAAPLSAGDYQLELTLSAGDVPVQKLKSMISLPEGWVPDESSIRWNGEAFGDYQLMGSTLVFDLGNQDGAFEHVLALRIDAPDAGTEGAVVKSTGMFSTNTMPKARLPLLKLSLEPAVNETQSESTIKADWEKTQTIEFEEEEMLREHEQFDNAWLAQADNSVELLYPSENYSPPISAIRIGVKHDPRHKVKLTLNGREVSGLNYDGKTKNATATVAISRWRGVDIEDGDNALRVEVVDANGATVKVIERNVHYSDMPMFAELVPEKSVLVADGRNNPVIAVRFRDRQGYPARFGTIGKYEINAPYRGQDTVDEEIKSSVLSSLEDNSPKYHISNDGIAYIPLQATSVSGEVVMRFRFTDRTEEVRAWLEPSQREWVLLGIAEGTISEHMVSGDKAGRDASDMENGTVTDGRVAFFAKGSIKGEWLLTVSYDTDKEKESRFKQSIDPDTYYTLYGDNTTQQYDAASSSKLYIKLEKQRFYAMFGDFDTGLTVTELGDYNRSFTGFKTEYKGKQWELNAFVTETEQSYLRDELRGDGSSGIYRLTRGDILPNSEKVTLETRDRFHSETVINSESLNRYIDYSIDYDTGALWFKQPILARDSSLNPVYIVVEYESEDEKDNHLSGGGRVAYKPAEQVEVGLTLIAEGNKGAEGQLAATDLTYQFTENLELKAEIAHSEREQNFMQDSGKAYTTELTWRDQQQETRVYLRDISGDFGLGQQNLSELSTRKYGVENNWKLDDDWLLDSEAYRQINTANSDYRSVVESRLDYRQDLWNVYSGLRYAEDNVAGQTFSSSQWLLGGSRKLGEKLTVYSDAEFLLNSQGDEENADFPNRLGVGGDYTLNDKIDLFLRQEISWGEFEDTETTLAGIRSRPWVGAQTTTTLQRETTLDGERLFATSGLVQNFSWGEGWRGDVSLDRSQTISTSGARPAKVNTAVPSVSGPDGEDYAALSVGIGRVLAQHEWTSRIEYRKADSEEKWNAAFGFHRDLSKGIALSTGVLFNHTLNNNGERNNLLDINLNMGWRPLDSNWIIFERLDLIFEEQNGGAFDSRTRKLVQNLHANYQPDMRNQYAFQYSAKYVLDTIDEDDYHGFTDFWGAEYRRFIDRQWDVGIQGGVLHNWDANNWQGTAGVSLGYSPVKNTWLSVGYNFIGFRDDDFSNADYTDKGFFIRFRIKFDQESLRDMVKAFR